MSDDHIFAQVPSLVDGAVRVFEQEIANGLTPQAAMRAVLDRALSLHATALAGEQREFADQEDAHLATTSATVYVQGIRDAADLIDPSEETDQ